MIGLKKSLNKSIKNGLSVLQVPVPLKMSEWADENFYLSEESSSITGAWETLPYQKAPMNALSNDDIEVVTWLKSKRIGYTKIITCAVGYFAEHKRRNQLIYQPTDSDAKEYVKDEIDPMLRDVPVVRSILKCSPSKKSPFNTLTKKGFLGSTLDVKGGTSARNFRRMTKDIVYYDELDGFDSDVGKEGSSVKLGDGRIETSSFPKSIRGSTPKVRGASQIEDSYNSADMQFRRHLPCLHCEDYAPIEFRNLNWTDGDPATVKLLCESCGALTEHKDYAKMDKDGQWQTDNGIWIDDDDVFRSHEGYVIDPPHHIAFHLWSAYSYFSTWSRIIKEFLEATAMVKKGDTTDLKTFTNTVLGETWEEEGEKADPDILYKRRENYSLVPDKACVLTAFVDVQDDRVECGVTAWCEDEESYEIDYFRLYGNLGLAQIWSNLADKLRESYKKEDGTLLEIALSGIDSGGHYTDETYKFSKIMGIRKCIPTKGSSEYGKPIAMFPKKKSSKGVYLTMIGTDTAKELVYSRYQIHEPGPGYCHHPISDKFDQDYFKQATAEEKLKKYKKGNLYFIWDAKKRRNEVLDCKVGNLAMVRILQQHFGLQLKSKVTKIKVDNTAKKKDSWIGSFDNWMR